MMSLDKSVHKRLKVTLACSVCRRKKTKCDGNIPCLRCLKYKTKCTYEPPSVTSQSDPIQQARLPRLPKNKPARFTQPLSTNTTLAPSQSSTMAIEKRLTSLEEKLENIIHYLEHNMSRNGAQALLPRITSRMPRATVTQPMDGPLKRQQQQMDILATEASKQLKLPPIQHRQVTPASKPSIRDLLNSDEAKPASTHSTPIPRMYCHPTENPSVRPAALLASLPTLEKSWPAPVPTVTTMPMASRESSFRPLH